MVRWSILALFATVPAYADEPVSFRDRIAPIFQQHCVSCHSGSKPKGDLDLTDRKNLLEGGANGPAIVPGHSSKSLLVRMLAEKKMPPKNPLPPEAIALLSRWIDDGAKWEGGSLQAAKAEPAKRGGTDWWSLQPIRRPAIPRPADDIWCGNAIDTFIKATLEAKSLKPNAETDRRTLIRRVTMDLTGLRPSPEEVAAFELDHSPLAYERLVDRLLASPAYGERWARHWLDVVRFAESHGYEVNTLRLNAWPYRDWVIRAFNRDLQFERFVREQLAGNAIADADDLTQAATGFIVGGAHDLVGNATEEGKRQQRSDDLFDMVSTTSTAFLGLTAGCARCHDHKFDPISQRDFYSLEAIFAGVDHAERPVANTRNDGRIAEEQKVRKRLLELDRLIDASEPIASSKPGGTPGRGAVNSRRNVERFAPVEAKFVRFTVIATNDGTQPCIDELEIFTENSTDGNIALASKGAKAAASSEYPNAPIHKIPHLIDGLHGNGRSWISNEPGQGWAQIELAKAARISRIVWGRDREQRFRDRTAVDYKIEVSLDGKAWQTVAGSWDRGSTSPANTEVARLTGERDTLQARLSTLEKPAMMYAGAFRAPGITHMLKRGDVMQRGEAMMPGAINGIGPKLAIPTNASDSERRNALATWLTSAENPLPARVMVNRLWQNHFGQGLVRTPSDFGFNGDRPSHPELLDWLASEYRANGGHMKPLHRLIVLSNTYRQSSRIDPQSARTDADARYLWRFPSQRISAEALRDTVLQTTGSLNRIAGGPGYNLWTYSNYVTVFTPKPKLGLDEFRRMIYQFKPRTQQDATFGAFDCPDATTVVPKRLASTTALQALNLLNDEFMFDQGDRLATRVKTMAAHEREHVVTAFRLAFQRTPSQREADAAEKLVREHGLSTLCRVLMNANEFLMQE